jgi:uncharacterized protein (DUF488 family)
MKTHRKIFTIGHSNHSAEFFLELLRAHTINCIVDVRSVPASRFSPQFGKARLASFLKENGIEYLHFGEEFGARRTNPEQLDEEGRVDFEKVRATAAFKSGVARLQKGVDHGFRIALMCAEADPLSCHRFAMISGALEESGFDVQHILKDKSLVSNPALEKQMLDRLSKKLKGIPLFGGDFSASHLRAAYRLMNKTVGYSPEEIKDFKKSRGD